MCYLSQLLFFYLNQQTLKPHKSVQGVPLLTPPCTLYPKKRARCPTFSTTLHTSPSKTIENKRGSLQRDVEHTGDLIDSGRKSVAQLSH